MCWGRWLTGFSELPSNLVLKKVSPKIWLPALTAVWGILTMCLGFVTGFASFVSVRALLGVAEGGLLPGMVSLYLSFETRMLIVARFSISHTSTSEQSLRYESVSSTPLHLYRVHLAASSLADWMLLALQVVLKAGG
jgi:hypothetical protein